VETLSLHCAVFYTGIGAASSGQIIDVNCDVFSCGSFMDRVAGVGHPSLVDTGCRKVQGVRLKKGEAKL